MKSLIRYINEKFQVAKNMRTPDIDPYSAKDFAPDDILVATFHYSMILVKFYKVLANNGKTVKVIELGDKIDSGSYMRGTCVPETDKTVGDPISVRIKKSGSLYIKNYFCKLWDGESVEFDHLD